ncbi:MAG: hypothetical protein ACP5N3_02580 [Candidatus Nanoarchaeia archaeon]
MRDYEELRKIISKPVKIYSSSLLEAARQSIETVLTQHINKGIISSDQLEIQLGIYDALTHVCKLYHEGRDQYGEERTSKIFKSLRDQNSIKLEQKINLNVLKEYKDYSQLPFGEVMRNSDIGVVRYILDEYIKHVEATNTIGSINEGGIKRAIDLFGHSPEALLLHGVIIKDEELPLLNSKIPRKKREQLRKKLKITPDSHVYYLDGGITWKDKDLYKLSDEEFKNLNQPMSFYDPSLQTIRNQIMYLDRITLTDPQGNIIANKVTANYDPNNPILTSFEINEEENDFIRTMKMILYGNMRSKTLREITLLLHGVWGYGLSEENGHISLVYEGKAKARTDDAINERAD